MAGTETIERLRNYLRELSPPARALLVGEFERSLLRGDEAQTSSSRSFGASCATSEGVLRVSATPRACSSGRLKLSWSTTARIMVIRAALPALRLKCFGPGCAAICCPTTPRQIGRAHV